MMSEKLVNPFSLAEDALLMSILKRWTNVVYEYDSDVVTSTDKNKAWKKIEQTFNHLAVDGNKGYKTAEVLKVRSEHLERLKNRRELVQNLASGEGISICQKGSEPIRKYQPQVEKPESKYEGEDDGNGSTSTDEATQCDGISNETEIGKTLLRLFKIREKLLRKEIEIRIHHSKMIFEKEMEILEIKRKNLLPLQARSEPVAKAKRKSINRRDDYRQKPSWGQSVGSVRVDASKKLQSKIGKRRRKKVSSKNANGGGGVKIGAGNWGRLDEGTTDNEDLASLTDDDGMVKLVLEQLKMKKGNEASRSEKYADDTKTEGSDSKMDFADNSERTTLESKIEEFSVKGNGSVSDTSLPTKLSNIIEKILRKDSSDELGKRNRIEK